MKKIAFVIFLYAVCITNTFAQYTDRIVIKAGDDIMSSLAKQIYMYPEFTEGIVMYRDGQGSRGILNYNLMIGEMQFINENKDTMSIANEKTLDYIKIAKDSFFFDKGYLVLITSNPIVKLAVKQRIKVLDKQKIGGYGQPSSTGSIDSYNSVQNGTRSYKLDVQEDVILAKETSHYIGDKFNHFLPANKKNLMKLYGNKQSEVEKYLSENNVDFNKREDMIKLIEFLRDIKGS